MPKIKYKIDPKEYYNLLKEVNLRSISLVSSTSRIKRENWDKSMSIGISRNMSHKVLKQAKILQINCKYSLLGSPEEGKSKDYAIKIEVTYELIYSFGKTLPKEFIDIFEQKNVPLNSWPYFREFVQNMMQRMNVQPLTLPFEAQLS